VLHQYLIVMLTQARSMATLAKGFDTLLVLRVVRRQLDIDLSSSSMMKACCLESVIKIVGIVDAFLFIK